MTTPLIDFAALQRGDTLPPFEITLGADEVAAYLDATGEDPARWVETVPPLALGALTLAGLMERVIIPDGMVHTGQEFSFDGVVAYGQTLEASLSIARRSERKGAVMTVIVAVLRVDGAIVGTGRTSVLTPPAAGAAGESGSTDGVA